MLAFCANCGKQLPSTEAKFCPSCGVSVSSPGQMTQPNQPIQEPQQIPAITTPKYLGIFKELEPNEKIIYQGVTQTEVIFVKEAEIKKVVGRERKEVPISISSSFVYMTTQRLVFLKLFELSATELGEKSTC